MQTRGGAEAIGPIILGLKKPVHILQLGSSVREIINMVTIAVVDAQSREAEQKTSIKSDFKADGRTAKT
jgi:malate dehydrogenase (oxaloacetate-decarboxylating)(NADP+)